MKESRSESRLPGDTRGPKTQTSFPYAGPRALNILPKS